MSTLGSSVGVAVEVGWWVGVEVALKVALGDGLGAAVTTALAGGLGVITRMVGENVQPVMCQTIKMVKINGINFFI